MEGLSRKEEKKHAWTQQCGGRQAGEGREQARAGGGGGWGSKW